AIDALDSAGGTKTSDKGAPRSVGLRQCTDVSRRRTESVDRPSPPLLVTKRSTTGHPSFSPTPGIARRAHVPMLSRSAHRPPLRRAKPRAGNVCIDGLAFLGPFDACTLVPADSGTPSSAAEAARNRSSEHA